MNLIVAYLFKETPFLSFFGLISFNSNNSETLERT